MDEGFLAANPLARIRLPKQRRKPRPILSLTEEAKLLGAAAPHLRLLIIGALDSGMYFAAAGATLVSYSTECDARRSVQGWH